MRLYIVLRHALPVEVQEAEVILGPSPWSAAPAVPLHRLDVILRHTAAHIVHDAKGALNVGIALVGQRAID